MQGKSCVRFFDELLNDMEIVTSKGCDIRIEENAPACQVFDTEMSGS